MELTELDLTVQFQKEQLENIFQEYIYVTYPSYAEFFLIIPVAALYNLFLVLKYDFCFQFKHLIDIVVVDEPGKELRFTISYCLLSTMYNQRYVVSTQINEFTSLTSLVSIFKNANWAEREIWDLYGINFFNHPDLRRILTDYGFEGFPLRKDFPLSGYKEIFYSDALKTFKYEKLELTQAFRNFKYYNPWFTFDVEENDDE